MMKRLASGVAVVAIVMGGMAFFSAFGAEASGTPTITITPSTGLTNDASVTITGSGFTANDSVYAVECLATATSAAGCDTATATPITVGADGLLPTTKFKVVTGTVGTGTCGTSSSNLGNCVIEVANIAGGDAGATPISFKAPTTTTPTTTTTTTPRPAPRATRTIGFAVRGKTVVITVVGSHFTAVSRVSGPAGATISVKSVTASKLTLKIKEAANARKGTFTLTIHFKSGKTATVKYTVK